MRTGVGEEQPELEEIYPYQAPEFVAKLQVNWTEDVYIMQQDEEISRQINYIDQLMNNHSKFKTMEEVIDSKLGEGLPPITREMIEDLEDDELNDRLKDIVKDLIAKMKEFFEISKHFNSNYYLA